jgi:hypothetical protein
VQRLGRPRQGFVDDEAHGPGKEVIIFMTTSIAVIVVVAEAGTTELLYSHHFAPSRRKVGAQPQR